MKTSLNGNAMSTLGWKALILKCLLQLRWEKVPVKGCRAQLGGPLVNVAVLDICANIKTFFDDQSPPPVCCRESGICRLF